MNWSDLNLMPAMPEIVLLALLGVVLLVDLWICDKNRYLTHLMSLGTVIIVAVTQLAVWEQGSVDAFHGMYIADGMSRLAKLVLYALTFGLFIYSKPYNQDRQIFKGEFYTLSLFALLGMSVMVSSAHFLTAYIGLELLSLSLYAMIALRRDSGRSAEAALKYFVLGALASGLLLYGISMVYGATGSLDFASVLASAFNEQANEWLLKLGMVFIVVAIAFKLGAVPFHMWVPDVYDARRPLLPPLWVRLRKLPPLSLRSVSLLPVWVPYIQTGRRCWPSLPLHLWWSVTLPPSCKPISNVCLPIPPYRTWALSCWRLWQAQSALPQVCITPLPML